MEIKINKLQHIGIPVKNIEQSEAFYQQFGFKNVMSSTFLSNGEKGTVTMMQLSDIIIELYQLPAIELDEIKNRKNGHIDHIAFDVYDINQTFKTLKSAGFNIIEPKPVFLQFWQNGCKYFNLIGPNDERLEFNQII